MDTSVFLARLIGPVLLVIGLQVALRPDRMRRIGETFLASEALIFLSGILTLPTGLAIVIVHNVWEADWRVVITLFGWLAIIAGIARIWQPAALMSLGRNMLARPFGMVVPGGLMALLGAFLSFRGYLA
jgi:hypothetical protein